MQVTDVLEKITDRNAPVIGCIARKGAALHHNLDGFDMDHGKIADTMDDLLAVTGYLDAGEAEVDTVITEFDGNCLIGQRVDDVLLVTVADRLQRAGFKKLQVGLSLQTRLLSKTMDDVEATPAPVAAPAPAAEPKKAEAPKSAWGRFVKAIVAEAPEAPAVSAADAEANKGKTRKMYRGQVYYE